MVFLSAASVAAWQTKAAFKNQRKTELARLTDLCEQNKAKDLAEALEKKYAKHMAEAQQREVSVSCDHPSASCLL